MTRVTATGVLRPRFFDCMHLDGLDLLDALERVAALRYPTTITASLAVRHEGWGVAFIVGAPT